MFKLFVLLTIAALASAELKKVTLDQLNADMARLSSKYASPEGYTQITMDSAAFGPTPPCKNCKAVVDPTTSLIPASAEAIKKFNMLLPMSENDKGQYFFPCFIVRFLPNYKFVIGGKAITLKPDQFVINVDGKCMSSIVNLKTDFWILGDLVINQYNADYDAATNPLATKA